MPGYEENVDSISLDADASIGIFTGPPGVPGSASPNGGMQYHFVKNTGAHQAGLCTSASDPITGILRNKPQVPGAASTVGVRGVILLTAGGVIAADDPLCPDAQGRAVKDTGGVATRKVIAQAPAAGVGVLFPALLV